MEFKWNCRAIVNCNPKSGIRIFIKKNIHFLQRNETDNGGKIVADTLICQLCVKFLNRTVCV